MPDVSFIKRLNMPFSASETSTREASIISGAMEIILTFRGLSSIAIGGKVHAGNNPYCLAIQSAQNISQANAETIHSPPLPKPAMPMNACAVNTAIMR